MWTGSLLLLTVTVLYAGYNLLVKVSAILLLELSGVFKGLEM